jgi:hypothetical protein
MSAAHQGGATANFKNKEKTLFNDMLVIPIPVYLPYFRLSMTTSNISNH